MAKWIAGEKVGAGLRHAVVSPNVTGRTRERIVQEKRVRAGSLAIVGKPQGARTCIVGVLSLPMQYCLSLALRFFYVTVLFRSTFLLTSNPWPFDQSFFDIMCIRTKEMSEATTIFSVEAAGHLYNQMNDFVDLEGNVNHNAEVCDIRRTDGERGLRGGSGKRVDRVSPRQPQSFWY